MNKSTLFTKAHAIARNTIKFVGNYSIAFSFALKEVYKMCKDTVSATTRKNYNSVMAKIDVIKNDAENKIKKLNSKAPKNDRQKQMIDILLSEASMVVEFNGTDDSDVVSSIANLVCKNNITWSDFYIALSLKAA